MRLWIAAFGCALAFALAIPVSQEAKADGFGYRPVRHAYGPVVFTRKKCIAPARDGARVSWICNAAETCCYDWLFRRGTCTVGRCL
jgi:hypothetical protein